METLENAKNAVDNLISTEEKKLDILKQVKLLLNAEELNAGTELMKSVQVPHLINRSELNDGKYPKRKSMIEKLEYLLNKEGRALKSIEFFNLIENEEGPKAAKKVKNSFGGKMGAITKKGRSHLLSI